MFSSLQQKLNSSPLFGQPQVMTGNIISWSEYNQAIRQARYNNPEDACDATVRINGSDRVKVDVGLPGFARELDLELGDEQWQEVSRTTSSVEVSEGVFLERIDSVTFARPSGPNTTLILNNPPITGV